MITNCQSPPYILYLSSTVLFKTLKNIHNRSFIQNNLNVLKSWGLGSE